MRFLLLLPALLCVAAFSPKSSASARMVPNCALPKDCQQVLVSIADSWNSHRGVMYRYQKVRDSGTSSWRVLEREGIPILLGKNGLAWGLGICGQEQVGLKKREGDMRAPAGIFQIGKVYGSPSRPPRGLLLPYVHVDYWSAWPDDPRHPYYNRFLRIDPRKRVPTWFQSQRMKPEEPVYKYRLEIRHNSNPPQPGRGSAIFFHIRRGEDRATGGCTTMREDKLLMLLRWLDPRANPCYAILPRAEYHRLREPWRLP